jgi:hypothetical protein
MASDFTTNAERSIQLASPAFAYVGDSAKTNMSELAATVGGLVFGGHAGQASAFEFRRAEPDRPILLDSARYALAKDEQAQFFDPVLEAVSIQTHLGVAAYLSPSPMTPRRDVIGLRSILEDGEAFAQRVRSDGEDKPVFTTLVVTPEWLTEGLDDLVACIEDHSNPVAFVPASYGDLFDEREHVQGILTCLEVATGALMLRCDLSGLGLWAYGSSAVCIGTSTGSRHRYLPRPSKKRRGDQKGSPKAILLGDLMAFLRVNDLYLHEGDPDLVCACSHCEVAGGDLLRFADPGMFEEADLHTGAVWKGLLDNLIAFDVASRPAAWRQLCANAEEEFGAFVERTSAPFVMPHYLSAWLQV